MNSIKSTQLNIDEICRSIKSFLSQSIVMSKSKPILILLSFLFLFPTIKAQDVAFTGWDGDIDDKFSFVLLRDYTAGEVIYFTEEDYSDATNDFAVTEGHLAYTIPAGGLLENEVITITESSANAYTVSCAGGTATHVSGTGSWSFSNADEIYAYSASSAATPWNTITEIHSFAYFQVPAIPATQDPSSDYPNVIVIAFNIGGSGGVNADFNDGARVNTTLAMLQDGANWTQSTGAISLSCTDFTNNLLPVELISFDVKLRNNEIHLNWSTASEINNERFEVEHSKDALNFTLITMVKGQGDSHELNSYQAKHYTPLPGANYYRLKQIDFDGAFSYSDIEHINFNTRNQSMSAYPNPFHSSVTVLLQSNDDYTRENINTRTINVFDVYGKHMKSEKVSPTQTEVSIDLSDLMSGTYFIKYDGDQHTTALSQRITKI